MRGIVGISLAGLIAGAAGLGLLAGWRWSPLDRGAAIARVAEVHAAEHGGKVEDCVGVPGAEDVWLRVVCRGTTYVLDRRARIVDVREPEA